MDRIISALKHVRDSEDEIMTPELKHFDLAKIFKEAEQGVKHFYCIICMISKLKEINDRLQQHHIAGKIHGTPNFDDTISVCGSCHDYLSDHQKDWLIQIRTDKVRLSSYYYGWADVFELLSEKSRIHFFKALATKFRSVAYHIRNQGEMVLL